jgi:energy-coupling factor transporter transmembrane protein EcfT
VPLWIFWSTGHTLSYPTTRIISFVLLGFVTAGLVLALIFLIHDLTHFKRGFTLLQTAGLLWVFNVLVFALWYWHTDSGGPRKRHETNHKAVDLQFPQQQDGKSGQWGPDFIDYLFVAFTGATAFSPTDTFPLTHRAKLLMMVEGTLSLIILAVLISRVANIF